MARSKMIPGKVDFYGVGKKLLSEVNDSAVVKITMNYDMVLQSNL
jgi:hypothetical protein